MMQVRKLLFVSLISLALLPATASAQSWFFAPYVGANFGGQASFNDFTGSTDDQVEKRIDFGGTIGWNPSVVGFEFDLGFSPNFFQDTAGDANFNFGTNNVTTLMGNLLISAPPGKGVRPYLSTGLGLIRANVSSADGVFNDLSTNDLGLDIGAGLNGQFTERVGLRGDVRYFRKVQDSKSDAFNIDDLQLGSFDFWRGTIGMTFRW
jgi:opacity protein-like surface antigen